MTYKLGLTGSIGMGKSTTARMFAEDGCAVWDADAAVHRLYAQGGAAVAPMAETFPGAIVDGAVSRARLKELISADPAVLREIERIVHPLVAQDREEFLAGSRADIIVLDIPLLFETGGDTQMDSVAVVTVDAEEQRRRLMARGQMTQEQIDEILRKQMPDAEKRRRADHVIVTDTVEHARQQVQDLVRQIRAGLRDA